ncbi:methyltransferase domain-containing protein [Rhodophyticola sp. CCM32]|uniref:class I SAM-dependent methyltransferase n=1 Tax=Rhodophyticola sp. CCM32 TaxID=2916397 RepID=UPI00107FBFDD|nr:methyltransferase domain-containing protein [Rhodophyticola sp. CCM32]QBX99680.1 methyltransferase domain-containing protein [Rhodophyticola sp. CCM32]
MHLDVLDLRQFYYRTRLGRIAQKAVRDQMLTFWPDGKGLTMAGFGFAVPLLRPYLPDARRVIGLMPAEQGVMPWPAGAENVSVLCREGQWPLQTGFADRVVCLHGLETSEHPAAVLEECARVLGPGGRALFIVPNRSGLWARRDATPFGFGRPYSLSQLEAQLKRHGFVPERHAAALFAPPSNRRAWLRSAEMVEKMGRKLSSYYAGGVILVEATKQAYAPTRPGLAEQLRRPLRVLDGVPQPAGLSGGGFPMDSQNR